MQITHIIPKDNYNHLDWECPCHPRITEGENQHIYYLHFRMDGQPEIIDILADGTIYLKPRNEW